MDLAEAIRIAEKIRPWINRMPELRAALDHLLDLGRNYLHDEQVKDEAARTPAPDVQSVPFASKVVVFADGWMQARLFYGGTDSDDVPHGAECGAPAHHLCTCDEAGQRREATANAARYYRAVKVGDEVSYAQAIELPVGTVLTDQCNVRGIVTAHPDPLMRIVWAAPPAPAQTRWPATITVTAEQEK